MPAMRATKRRKRRTKAQAPAFTVADYYRGKLQNPNASQPSWQEYKGLANAYA